MYIQKLTKNTDSDTSQPEMQKCQIISFLRLQISEVFFGKRVTERHNSTAVYNSDEVMCLSVRRKINNYNTTMVKRSRLSAVRVQLLSSGCETPPLISCLLM